MTAWLAAFVITQCVETPIYAWRLGGRPRAWWIAFAASCWTHPFIFLALPGWLATDWWTYFLVAEAVAVVGEALWLGLFGLRAPMLWALVANAASVAIGQTCRAIWGWP